MTTAEKISNYAKRIPSCIGEQYSTAKRCGVSIDSIRAILSGKVMTMNHSTVYLIFDSLFGESNPLPSIEELRFALNAASREQTWRLRRCLDRSYRVKYTNSSGISTIAACRLADVLKQEGLL